MLVLAAGDISFELRIAGYQYPSEATADYDCNWLMIEGNVKHPRGNWQFLDPSLLTYEVAELAGWLEEIPAKANRDSTCDFTEPNLSFEVLDDFKTRILRVSFALESLPPWAKRGEDACIEFPVNELDLIAAATALREQLSQYPQRGPR